MHHIYYSFHSFITNHIISFENTLNYQFLHLYKLLLHFIFNHFLISTDINNNKFRIFITNSRFLTILFNNIITSKLLSNIEYFFYLIFIKILFRLFVIIGFIRIHIRIIILFRIRCYNLILTV